MKLNTKWHRRVSIKFTSRKQTKRCMPLREDTALRLKFQLIPLTIPNTKATKQPLEQASWIQTYSPSKSSDPETLSNNSHKRELWNASPWSQTKPTSTERDRPSSTTALDTWWIQHSGTLQVGPRSRISTLISTELSTESNSTSQSPSITERSSKALADCWSSKWLTNRWTCESQATDTPWSSPQAARIWTSEDSKIMAELSTSTRTDWKHEV